MCPERTGLVAARTYDLQVMSLTSYRAAPSRVNEKIMFNHMFTTYRGIHSECQERFCANFVPVTFVIFFRATKLFSCLGVHEEHIRFKFGAGYRVNSCVSEFKASDYIRSESYLYRLWPS